MTSIGARLLPVLLIWPGATLSAADKVDFNREIRAILSNNCYTCHGPDSEQRQADLRLDQREAATAVHDGQSAIRPGMAEASEMIRRITATDDSRMPPADVSTGLNRTEVELLTRWINEGADYARHWSLEPPNSPPLPEVSNSDWIRNPIDRFVLSRLNKTGLGPSPRATREALIRRVSLDLTGLPPSPQQIDAFVKDTDPRAYEKLVERLLESSAYGERWAALWLDLARYADSAGYANDPNRTIWLYRDWVIEAFNSNMPFDQFTIEQIAGDMLPGASESQKIATAFHRNTLTNSEGGTNDEEFRNVAIVDRVNTTMEVWMGTTIACAQCHNHKYDPISQKEYFQLFAFLNNTADNDRANEAPLLSVLTESQKSRRQELETKLAELREMLKPTAAQIDDVLKQWQPIVMRRPDWFSVSAIDPDLPEWTIQESTLRFEPSKDTNAPLQLNFQLQRDQTSGLRLRLSQQPTDPGSVPSRTQLNELTVNRTRKDSSSLEARYVRVDLPGDNRFLHLAEVQIFAGNENLATSGKASQSSTDFGGDAKRAIDGNTDGDYQKNSVSHTAGQKDPWFEIDLNSMHPIDRVVVWNRTDNNLQSRLNGYTISLLDDQHKTLWTKKFDKAPASSENISISGDRLIPIRLATADGGLLGQRAITGEVAGLTDGKTDQTAWQFETDSTVSHLVMALESVLVEPEKDQLQITLNADKWKSGARYEFTLESTSADQESRAFPRELVSAFERPAEQRDQAQLKQLEQFATVQFKASEEVLGSIKETEKQIQGIKPVTVPVMEELAQGKRRTTRIQIRGNFMVTSDEVQEATPAVLHSLPADAPANRLSFARWLVDRSNPLTARVQVNRFWTQLFGVGLVRTNEDFGNQGETPSHPLLLDWLAVNLMDNGWDMKHLLRTIVLSATYQQSSRTTAELAEADPFNRLLSRGPRHRLSAEMIRDQALAAAGLLSERMNGPSVNPPRPKLGLRAAFGGSTDWETSGGEDRFRRGLYTFWRRSMPYPSMATFDAPSRNVCTSRRIRTNTPLQALVTLNDPVYIEAAQGLGRRALREGGAQLEEQLAYAFRLCVCRWPDPDELGRLIRLFESGRTRFADHPEDARKLATEPIGPVPQGQSEVNLAAWTLVGNVLLNLDETLSKR